MSAPTTGWGLLLENLTPTQAVPDTSPSIVAVILRTRDRPILFRRALSSVGRQTHQRWHLHIVNDGGDRDLVDANVAEHAALLGDRVTVLHNARSLGMEAASNQALASADAACFVVHDDDDSWDPRFLAEAVAFLDLPENAAYIGVATGCTKVYERIESDRIIIDECVADADVPKIADLEQLLVINRAPPICLMFRMSLIGQLGSFNANLPVLGDWEFNIRALLFGDIGPVATPLAFYHMRRTPPSAAYGNSVLEGKSVHGHYDRLVRNSVARRSIACSPELLGILQPVVHAIAAARDMVINHTNRVTHAVIEQQNRNNAMLIAEMIGMLREQEEAIVGRVIGALEAGITK
jgi:glycosyltransferase involved in cell wall biosynthesis